MTGVDKEDKGIITWLRKARALSEQLMVSPSEVYDTLIARGYTEARKQKDTSDYAISVLEKLFRPTEELSVALLAERIESLNIDPPLATDNVRKYIVTILLRNSEGKGRNRFRRSGKGYRLNLSNADLRHAILVELDEQRQFISTRRLQELFDVSYERVLEALRPALLKGEITSRTNKLTRAKDWCLTKYPEALRGSDAD